MRQLPSSLGRFLTPDTVIPAGGRVSAAFNRYLYARANPIRYTDPSGHSWADALDSWDDWMKMHFSNGANFLGLEHLHRELQGGITRYKNEYRHTLLGQLLNGMDNLDVYGFAKTWKSPHEAWESLDPETKVMIVGMIATLVSIGVMSACMSSSAGLAAVQCATVAGMVSGAIRGGGEAQIAGEGYVGTSGRALKGALAGGVSAAISQGIVDGSTKTGKVTTEKMLADQEQEILEDWVTSTGYGAMDGALDAAIYESYVNRGNYRSIFVSAALGGASGAGTGFAKWNWSSWARGASQSAGRGVIAAAGHAGTYVVLSVAWDISSPY